MTPLYFWYYEMSILTDNEYVPPGYTGIVQRLSSKEWYFEGLWHRADGPAIEWAGK